MFQSLETNEKMVRSCRSRPRHYKCVGSYVKGAVTSTTGSGVTLAKCQLSQVQKDS